MLRCAITLSMLVLLSAITLPVPAVEKQDPPRDEQQAMRVFVDASIVPRPGEPLGLSATFDRPMDPTGKLSAELVFPGSPPQVLSEGAWNQGATVWTFKPVKLAPARGLGRLVVGGAKTPDGKSIARHEEPLVVGAEPILDHLKHIAQWMVDHPHDFIFVEGYYYRTFLALYEITGEKRYLEHASKGAYKLLDSQHTHGFWGTGYNNRAYLADTGSALGLFINFYKFADHEERLQIDNALDLYRDLLLVKGDDKGRPFVHADGSVGIGFRDFKDGKIIGGMNKPYTIATALSGAEIFAALHYIHGKESDKQIAARSCDWLFNTMNDEGVFPYIIDDWDPSRKKIWTECLYSASAYVGEGLIAAWTYIDDPKLRREIERRVAPHIEWLLRTQNADGSWDKLDTFGSYRSHGVVNLLVWYHENVRRDARVASAVRRYYLLLLDKDRKSYIAVASPKFRKSTYKVAPEYVATCLAGRALAEIVKPGVDCYRWKEKQQ